MPQLTEDKRIHLDNINGLTDQLEELSSQLKKFRNLDNDLDENEEGSLDLLKQKTADLRRKIREFDSDLFIVATLGMLKAGKSSLINLLSRSSLASPIGYGHDTTLRPALITQAPEETPDRGNILVWFAKDKVSFTDALDDVIDYIRGISKGVTKATQETHELTQENLNILLCKTCAQAGNMLHAEPILVVVQVPRSSDSILSDNIVLLDTPGLDSNTSIWTSGNHWYEWIVNRCDLRLFLQSSVAPLNEKANVVLKSILDKNRKASIWLLQNQMEGKFWYAPEVINKENGEQAKHAFELFKAVDPDVTERMLRANLGKASTAILEKDPALANFFTDGAPVTKDILLAQSDFENLQSRLGSDLQENAETARLNNCIGDLFNATGDLRKQWQSHMELLGRDSVKLEEKIKKIEEEQEIYLSLLIPHFSPLSQDGDGHDILTSDRFCKMMVHSFNEKFQEDGISAKKLNEFASEMRKLAQEECQSKADHLRPELVSITNNGFDKTLKSCIEKSVDEFLKEKIEQFTSRRDISMALNTISRGELSPNLSSDYTPNVLSDGFFRPILPKPRTWKIWEKKTYLN
ncbi:MAG: dynamin family protein, partial [Akkermansia sp.]